MNDLPGLIVPIEGRVDRLEKALQRANQSQRRFSSDIERRTRQSADRMSKTYARMGDQIGASFRKMVGPLAAVAGIASLAQLAKKAHDLAEGYKQVENRLAAIGQTSDEATEKLAGAAIRAGADLKDMSQVVMRVSKATNGGYDETIRRVETLQKLLSTGGASTAEANSVTLQLSQALSSGVLQGDELRSLREAAPVELLDAIARAAGGTRAELKNLGADGRLTTAVMLTALDEMAASADANFGKMAMTSDRAWRILDTGLTAFVGRLDEGMGASERFATGIADLGEFLNRNAGAAEEFGRSVMAALETAEQVAADAKQAMDDLADTIHQNTVGSVIDLGDTFADTGLTIGEVIDRIIDGMATFSGAMEGSAEAVREAFLKIPDAISGAMQASVNAVIAAVESMINGVLEGVRVVAQAVDDLTSKIPGTDGSNLAGGIGTVDLGRVDDFATNHSTRTIADAYREGQERGEAGVRDSVAAVEGYFAGVKDRFRENRARLEAEAAERDAQRGAQGVTDGDDAGSGGADAGGKGGGSKGRSGAAEKLDAFTREAQRIRERTAALLAEATALEAAAASGEEYGAAIEFARAKAELLVAAQRDGREITPELIAQIDRLAQSYVTAGLNAEEAADKIRKIEEQTERGRDALEGMFGSILDGSKSAKQAIGDLLLELARAQMLKAIFALPGMGGLASGVGGLLGFSSGGYTGHGGKFEPAGLVHRGEFVVSKAAVQRIGVGNLEGLHRAALRGYSDGGLVGGATANLSKSLTGSAQKSAPTINVTGGPITVNATGGTPEANADLAQRIARESEAAMRGLIQNEIVRQMRPGGMLR